MLGAGAIVGRFLLKLIAWTTATVFTALTIGVFTSVWVIPFVSLDFWPFKSEPALVADENAKPESPVIEKPQVLAKVSPQVLEEIVVPPYELAAAALARMSGGSDHRDKPQVATVPSSEMFMMAVTSKLEFNSAWAKFAWNTQLNINVSAFWGTTPAKPDLFASRTYQTTDQANSTALGFEQSNTKSGWCVMKSYLPCFMPPGHGREIVIREKAPDLEAE